MHIPDTAVITARLDIRASSGDRRLQLIRALAAQGARVDANREIDPTVDIESISMRLNYGTFRKVQRLIDDHRFFPDIVLALNHIRPTRFALLAVRGFAEPTSVLRLRRELADRHIDTIREQIAQLPLSFAPEPGQESGEAAFVHGVLLVSAESVALHTLGEVIALNAVPASDSGPAPRRFHPELHPKLFVLPSISDWSHNGVVESLVVEGSHDELGSFLSLHQVLHRHADLVYSDSFKLTELGEEVRPWRFTISLVPRPPDPHDAVMARIIRAVSIWQSRRHKLGSFLRATWVRADPIAP